MRHWLSKSCHQIQLRSLINICFITTLFLCSHVYANGVDEDNQRKKSTCIPCSATYLSSDPNYNIISSISVSTKSCGSLLNIAKAIKIPILSRSLEGEGSHRRLISKVIGIGSDSSSSTDLDGLNCELLIIESLNGVFADPFELQRLVNRKVYLDAAVFGDANLELPAALSNSSLVEIHMDLIPPLKENHDKLVIELPLHVRYPPLDASGYSVVDLSQPDLYIRCRKKDINVNNGCQWGVSVMEIEPTETLKWRIPCGDEAHSTVVSSFTFLSALICALAIVFSSIFYRPTIHTKDSS